MKGGEKKKRYTVKLSVLLNIVLIFVIIFAIVPFLNAYLQGQWQNQGWLPSQTGNAGSGTFSEMVQECVTENPLLSEEQCLDLRTHDMALLHGNSTLCDEISEEKIRNHCKSYFNQRVI